MLEKTFDPAAVEEAGEKMFLNSRRQGRRGGVRQNRLAAEDDGEEQEDEEQGKHVGCLSPERWTPRCPHLALTETAVSRACGGGAGTAPPRPDTSAPPELSVTRARC